MRLSLFLLLAFVVSTFADDSEYLLGPDSERKEGVPAGEVKSFVLTDSKVFPGTTHNWSLYIPKQYDPAKPACVMVFFDGSGYAKPDGAIRVPIVFDNLIAKKEMPVTLGVFINPGTFKATTEGAKDRSNRSVEYDTVSDANAKFVIDEIMPQVTNDYRVADDPAGWAVAGMSSGGIAAFTVAWERPDKFRKVMSWIGSFTNIRGGYVYPPQIRKSKSEPKPLRVFLQDGSNDLDNAYGNWPLSNQDMAAALKFAGYDYKFEYGTGAHSPKHGAAILPDILRWLWRDLPK
jgi:enterochelin esterase-like enzyme